MLVIAQLIDSESPDLKLFDQLLQSALATTARREEDAFFLDWDTKFLISIANFISKKRYDSGSFIPADKLTDYVVEQVQPFFKLRTESLSRKLDKESLLLERKLMRFPVQKEPSGQREKKQPLSGGEDNLQHKTGWRIDVQRLNKRIAKFRKYMDSVEQEPTQSEPSNDTTDLDLLEEIEKL